jgi:hypothetical protein
VLVHAFYRADEVPHYATSARLAREAIEWWSARLGPYVYPQATVVSGPVEGMEYPMLAFGGPARRIENMPDAVIVHELGHQWYPMMLGTHETRYPAMDEGMTTFITTLFMDRRFGPYNLWSPRMPLALRGLLGRGHERRFMQWLYTREVALGGDISMLAHANTMTDEQIGLLVYTKTSSALFMLRDVLGAETFDRAMRAYYDRWLLRHPHPTDFFNTVEDVAGRDLDWFWDQWFARTVTLDLAVDSVEQRAAGRRWQARVQLANRGTAIMPATVRLTLDDGSTRDVRVPETVWRGDVRTHALDVPDLARPVRSVEIDPAVVLADVRRGDNVWPAGTRAAMGPLFGTDAGRFWTFVLVGWIAALLARLAGHWYGARRAGARVLRLALGPLTVWTAHGGTRAGWTRRPRLFGGGTVSRVEHARDVADLRRPHRDRARRRATRHARARGARRRRAARTGRGADRRAARGQQLPGGLADRDRRSVRHPGLRHVAAAEPRAWLHPGAAVAAPPARAQRALGAAGRGARAVRELVAGERPSAWSAALVVEATRLHDRSRAEAGACVLAYYHASDREDLPAAAEWLARARRAADRAWRPTVRRNVLAECAFHSAHHVGDVREAREWLHRARRVERHVLLRARAAIALAGGDTGGAASLAAHGIGGLDAVRSRMGTGIAALEERWLRDILARCEEGAKEQPQSLQLT